MNRPALLYNLELTHQELLSLWIRFEFLRSGNKLDSDEEQVYEKLVRLVEGQ